jgi:hypothetical protein
MAMLLLIQASQHRLSAEDFARIRWRLYGALAGDLLAPVVAWYLIKAINRRRAPTAEPA